VTNIVLIIAGFALLAFGANRLIKGATIVARHYHVSPLVIGLTLVAIGTSLPEVVIGTQAAFYGNPEIALGNAVGSNIANLGLVLGLTVLLMPIQVHESLLSREFPLLFVIMLIALFLMSNGLLSRVDGLILLLVMLVTLWWLFKASKKTKAVTQLLVAKSTIPKKTHFSRAWLWIFLGLVFLPLGADLAIEHSIALARHFGLSELVIGLTIVALGTSLPELATTLVGAQKKQYDLVIGTILGSNMFNLLIVLALPALVHPIKVNHAMLFRDIPVMYGITFLLFGLLYFGAVRGQLKRLHGVILLAAYSAYLMILI